MKKKVIAGIVILVVAIGVIAFKPTLAWFVRNGPAQSQDVDLGYFEISLVGGTDCEIRPAFIDPNSSPPNKEYAAPGENMLFLEKAQDVWEPGPLVVLNKSTILTNLRVKIEYTYITAGGVATQEVYRPTQMTDFVVDFDEPDDWVYDAVTGCWNYRYGGTAGTIAIPAATDLINGETITLINSIGYSAALGRGNIYENKDVTVKLKVEAKQAEYGTWTQVGSTP